jgi:hypothetical protein
VFDLDITTREALTIGSLTDDQPWAPLPHTASWDDDRLAGRDARGHWLEFLPRGSAR